jgi:flavin-dependent dehydrogenase
MREQQCDVLILGGGPCGSTAAALLAQSGIRTTVIEAEAQPRFHVGESLLPHSLPLLERLGVLEEVKALPHTMKKDGATFVTHDGSKLCRYWFDAAMAPAIPNAYQVRRDEFDWLLLNNAERKGAELLLGWRADDPVWEGDRMIGVKARDANGEEVFLRAKMFLDASGQMGFLSRKQRTRVPYPGHQKIAAVTHFKGVDRGEGREQGNIVIAITDGGWFWLIPFADGTTSVGVVCDVAKWKHSGAGPEALFNEAVERTPEVARRLRNAERVLPFNAVQNFSFRVTHLSGPGYCAIGDAAGFLDPVFSTGVFISTTTAAQAADDIIAAWSKNKDKILAAGDMRKTTKHAVRLQKLFFSLIHSYYDKDFLALFFSPTDKLLRLQAAVTSILAADVLGPRTWDRVWRFRVLQMLAKIQGMGINLSPRLPGTPA